MSVIPLFRSADKTWSTWICNAFYAIWNMVLGPSTHTTTAQKWVGTTSRGGGSSVITPTLRTVYSIKKYWLCTGADHDFYVAFPFVELWKTRTIYLEYSAVSVCQGRFVLGTHILKTHIRNGFDLEHKHRRIRPKSSSIPHLISSSAMWAICHASRAA